MEGVTVHVDNTLITGGNQEEHNTNLEKLYKDVEYYRHETKYWHVLPRKK